MLEPASRGTRRTRFPPAARIRRSAEYRALSRRARRFHTAHFVVLYTAGSGPGTRTGITVSRRVGNAVIRNRVKRFVREFVRKRKGSLPRSFDLVIIAKPGAGACEHHEIDEELESFWAYLVRRKSRR